MGDQHAAGPRLKIAAVAAAMALAAAPLHLAASGLPGPEAPFTLPLWGLALAFAATELFVIHLTVRRDSHTVSISEVPFILGLAMVSPTLLVVARLIGSGSALIVRRQQPYKLAFNLALKYFEVAAAGLVYRLLIQGRSPVSGFGLLAGLAALVTAIVVGIVAVSLAIAINERDRPLRVVILSMGSGLVISGSAALIGLAGLVVAWREPAALVAVGIGGALLYAGVRLYGTLERRFANLQAVYSFTTAVDEAVDTDHLAGIALKSLRKVLRADMAEVVLSRGVGSTAVSLVRDAEVSVRPAPPDLLEAMGSLDVDNSSAMLLSEAPEQVRTHYSERGIEDGMLAVLGGGAGTRTLLLVADRIAPGGFGEAELPLFTTLSRHARVSLERGRLVDRLRREVAQKEHQALHDALTGLPNRLHFTIVVEDALRRARESGKRVGVVLVDLDHFQEVNDTLGHQQGDVLLQEMALRLSEVAGGDELLARLGGDEFGMVLKDLGGVSDAVGWARRIGSALNRPVVIEGLAIQVSGSVGISLAPDHGSDGETLIRRADVAMYQAKRSGSWFEVYDPQGDRYSTRRLAMAAELRSAIEDGEITVHYQPKAALADGRVVGIEALARWLHPRHGPIPPDEFVDLSMRTGLIGPLTEHVMRTSFADLSRLRRKGHRLGISVNVAATSLVDDQFPEMVSRLVHQFDLDPLAVTLEVTETSMMAESAKARLVLAALDDLGVRLSIDDFGTGYSSLTYLSNLPLDEVKIDRSFVMDMAVDERLAKIVVSTIGLAHSLDLRVVAEGVENQAAWDLLREAGCEIAQGFYLARPMAIVDLVPWLAAGAVPVDDARRSPVGPGEAAPRI